MSFLILNHFLVFLSFLSFTTHLLCSFLSYPQITEKIEKRNLELINNVSCAKFTSCFSCVSPNNEKDGCIWKNSQCISSTNSTEIGLNWHNKLLQCSDYTSKEMKEKYCGYLSNEDGIAKIKGSLLYGDDSVSNLFCTWEYIKSSKKPLNVDIEKNENCYLGIEVVKNSKTVYYEITGDDEFSEKFINYDSISLFYFGGELQNKEPFKMSLEVNKFYSFSQIALYLVIAAGVTLIIISLFMLGFFCMRFFKRNKFKKPETTSHVKSFSNYIINFTSFIDGIKIYNKKCPICLEEIINLDKVAILICFHGFHEKCLKEWILKDEEKNVFCPVCHLNFKNSKKDTEKGNLIGTIDSPIS